MSDDERRDLVRKSFQEGSHARNKKVRRAKKGLRPYQRDDKKTLKRQKRHRTKSEKSAKNTGCAVTAITVGVSIVSAVATIKGWI